MTGLISYTFCRLRRIGIIMILAFQSIVGLTQTMKDTIVRTDNKSIPCIITYTNSESIFFDLPNGTREYLSRSRVKYFSEAGKRTYTIPVEVNGILIPEFQLTADGLVSKADPLKTFLVGEVSLKSQSELYKNAIMYINRQYKNPEQVITGKVENELLKFQTYTENISSFRYYLGVYTVSCKYITEINFKDGKFKYEIVDLELFAYQNNQKISEVKCRNNGNWSIFKNNGDVRFPELRGDIETYFNLQFLQVLNALMADSKKSDW